MNVQYPFSAIVGQDDLKLALLVVAVDPGIGGVLIKGERGTAKSTIARALASLLPMTSDRRSAPFVELPLGATEDRVVGSLDISKALTQGRAELRSGLLARANGGVLYVDEVNLLPDHLVDMLLDSAASGWVHVERDSVSAGEAARFVLIGTMNPEEGELRPQFLDRFGLSVQVKGLATSALRMAAIRARLSFDENPQGILEAAKRKEDELRQSIVSAKLRLPILTIEQEHLDLVAAISAEHRLDGIRGDLAIIKAARAMAALDGSAELTPEHIQRAATFAVPHRSRRKPKPRPDKGPPISRGPDKGASGESPDTKADDRARSPPDDNRESNPAASSGSLSLVSARIDRQATGRRGQDSAAAQQSVRVLPFDGAGQLALAQTLTAAAMRGAGIGPRGVTLESGDLRQHHRRGAGHTNVLFVVDASSSMAAQRRIDIAKGAALALIQSSYQRRDEVALMVFRGEGTQLLLPFTNHVARVEEALKETPSGGRTPLARALRDATALLQTREPALMVIFTDGRANVSIGDGDPWLEALAACSALRSACAGSVVVNCEQGPITLGRAVQLAEALSAECVSLDQLQDSDFAIKINQRQSAE